MKFETIIQYATSAAVIVAVVGGFWVVPRWTGIVDTRLGNLEKTLEKTAEGISEISRWTGTVDARLDNLEKSTESTRDDIRTLFLMFGGKASAPGSPVQLTEFGKAISATVKAQEWSREHSTKLDLRQDAEEYEIFDEGGKYVENLFDSDTEFEKTVKSTAYQFGTDIEQVLNVYQIELRDHIIFYKGNSKSTIGDHDGAIKD